MRRLSHTTPFATVPHRPLVWWGMYHNVPPHRLLRMVGASAFLKELTLPPQHPLQERIRTVYVGTWREDLARLHAKDVQRRYVRALTTCTVCDVVALALVVGSVLATAAHALPLLVR